MPNYRVIFECYVNHSSVKGKIPFNHHWIRFWRRRELSFHFPIFFIKKSIKKTIEMCLIMPRTERQALLLRRILTSSFFHFIKHHKISLKWDLMQSKNEPKTLTQKPSCKIKKKKKYSRDFCAFVFSVFFLLNSKLRLSCDIKVVLFIWRETHIWERCELYEICYQTVVYALVFIWIFFYSREQQSNLSFAPIILLSLVSFMNVASCLIWWKKQNSTLYFW